MKGYSKGGERDIKGVLGSGVKEHNRIHERERGAGGGRMLAGGRHRGERRGGKRSTGSKYLGGSHNGIHYHV